MQDSQERSLREELYRAYVSRASSGDFNNTPIIEQILKLRSEKAKLLGFSNYAEVLTFVPYFSLYPSVCLPTLRIPVLINRSNTY